MYLKVASVPCCQPHAYHVSVLCSCSVLRSAVFAVEVAVNISSMNSMQAQYTKICAYQILLVYGLLLSPSCQPSGSFTCLLHHSVYHCTGAIQSMLCVPMSKLLLFMAHRHSTSGSVLLLQVSIMSAIRHPNVVLFMGVCLDPPCMVTEVGFPASARYSQRLSHIVAVNLRLALETVSVLFLRICCIVDSC